MLTEVDMEQLLGTVTGSVLCLAQRRRYFIHSFKRSLHLTEDKTNPAHCGECPQGAPFIAILSTVFYSIQNKTWSTAMQTNSGLNVLFLKKKKIFQSATKMKRMNGDVYCLRPCKELKAAGGGATVGVIIIMMTIIIITTNTDSHSVSVC